MEDIISLALSHAEKRRDMGKGQIAEKYVFEAKMRSKQYGSFDWGRPWTKEEAADEAEDEADEIRAG